MTPRFEGYRKSPDGFGTGTYEVLHPKGASIEIIRSIFEGNVLQITSVRNTPDPALEKALCRSIHRLHPYGLMLWAKTLEDITSSDRRTVRNCAR